MKFNCELKRVVDDSYDIEIGRKLQDTLVSDLKGGLVGKIKKFAVVTDSIVVNLYGRDIYDRLNAAGLKAELFVIPEGEKSKTRQMKEFVEDSMLEKGFRRDCCVVAVGGGVVTDLAGFVAGTFGRGGRIMPQRSLQRLTLQWAEKLPLIRPLLQILSVCSISLRKCISI